MRPKKMERSPERWAGMDPSALADGSRSQMMFALQDAKHDIAFLLEDLAAHEASNRIRGENLEALRAENAKLREALKRCRFDSLNMTFEDMVFIRAALGDSNG